MFFYGVFILPQGNASKLENNDQVQYRFFPEHLEEYQPHRQVYQPELG